VTVTGSQHSVARHGPEDGLAEAVDRVRRAMAGAVGLIPVVDAAATAICHEAGADGTGINLLDGREYWDLVEVWLEDRGYEHFPENTRYPSDRYPQATERLLSGKGYFSGDVADEVLVEYQLLWPELDIRSIMGVPIIALGEVHGEIFLLRLAGSPAFTRDDLDLVAELASILGARLPALLASYREGPGRHLPEAGGDGEQRTLSRLSAKLDDLLRPVEDGPITRFGDSDT
jgi:GAF domain-containing protein